MPDISTIYTRWRVLDSHWSCIWYVIFFNDGSQMSFNPAILPCLSEYLLEHNFTIPPCITYCLAENEDFRIKYRVHGGSVNLYINPVHKCEHKRKTK